MEDLQKATGMLKPSFTFSLDHLIRFLWAVALLALPVTSFRWFPFMGEGTYVRPLALYPLTLLLPLLGLQALRRRRTLQPAGALLPLVVLVLFILLATAWGAIINPIPLRGQVYGARALRALLTLGIGAAFFLSALWMNRDDQDLRFTLRWLLAGLCLDLAWSALQAITFYTGLLDKQMVTHWQLAFSMRELVRTNRISGLAYEPAWLSGQLSTLYIPVLFAALLTGFRLTRHKWLEPLLLAVSLLVLLATYSRGGLLTVLLAGALTFLFFGMGFVRSFWRWFVSGFKGHSLDILTRLAIPALIIVVLSGAALFLAQKNFFRRLWQSNASSLSEYLVDINAGARGAYGVGALAAFEQHPFTGVGLGASGFYIYQNLPDWSLTTVPEIAKQMNPENRLYPNPKNLYIRFLAEAGWLGFILFLAFQFHLLGDSFQLLHHTWHGARFIALAGVFAWIAITFYNFTQDSLATPNIWFIPGMLAGLSFNSTHKDVQ